MSGPRPLLTLLVLATLSVGLGISSAPAGRVSAGSPMAGEAVVRCEPVAVSGPAGTLLHIDLYVENITGLYGAEVRLSFDPAIAQVVDADPIRSGVQIQPLSDFLKPDLIVRREADNTAGAIRYAATQLDPHEPVSGAGPLARVTFEALTAGSFAMPFTYQKLGNRDGEVIPATTQDCSVSFGASVCYDFDEGQVPGIDDIVTVASRWRDAGQYDARYDVAPDTLDGIINIRDVMTVAAQLGQPCSAE